MATTASSVAAPETVSRTRMGQMVIESRCAPTFLSDWALQSGCGGTIINDGFRRIVVGAQPIVVDPHLTPTMQLGMTTWTLAPGQQITLPAPPSGWAWVLVDLNEAQAKRLAWGILGGLAIGSGFALYGVYAATTNVYHWWKRRHHKGGRS